MADKKQKRQTSAEQKKAYDKARSRTCVNIGSAFQCWRELKEREGLRSYAKVALFLLDRWVTLVFEPPGPAEVPQAHWHMCEHNTSVPR
uniref:Uncharacterized protein n=1 Tax=Cyprinus carpio TaxID=7962 RepID=A0A8C1IYK9_CYPCA